MDDTEALTEGLEPGAWLAIAREQILPPRTWVQTGADGVEIYLDTDQNTRILVRKVTYPTGPRQVDGEPTVLHANSTITVTSLID